MVDNHPIPDSEMPGTTPKASVSNAQNEAFGDKAEAFYSWYQSIRQLNSPTEGYHGLQYIMNISEKRTATKEEGTIAAEKLSQLTEEIDGGNQTLDKIPHEVEKIVDSLTNHNAKSRVVMQATKIQISVNLSESDTSEEVHQMINSLLGRVTKEMPNIKAEEISRILQDAIDHSEWISKILRQKVLSLLK